MSDETKCPDCGDGMSVNFRDGQPYDYCPEHGEPTMKTKNEPNEQPVANQPHKRITDIIKERNWKLLPAHLREDRIATVSSENTRDQQPENGKKP